MGLAARGARETDAGRVLIDDPDQATFFQKRARGIYIKTFVATLILMLAGRGWQILLG